MRDRGGLANRLLVPATVNPAQPVASATPTPGGLPPAPAMTPEQVREWWQPVLLGLLIAGVAVSLLGGGAVYWARHWDSDGDGVPQWIQEIAKRNSELDFARGWPAEYARFRSALAFAPGK